MNNNGIKDLEKIKEKVSNFFYYYWKILVVIVIGLVLFIFGVRSCVETERADFNIVIATDGYEISLTDPETGKTYTEHTIGTFTDAEESDMEKILEQYCKDYNENGNVKVNLTVVDLSTHLAKENYTLASTMQSKMIAEITTGETFIFVMAKSVADKYLNDVEADVFCTIGKVTGDENDLRSCIPITDTVFYTELNGTKRFSEDMVLLMRNADYSETGSIKAQNAKEVFYSLLLQK